MSKYVLTALAGGVVYAGIKHYINERCNLLLYYLQVIIKTNGKNSSILVKV